MTNLKDQLSNKTVILFDMDGTLVNTEPLHARAASLVLQEKGITVDLEAQINHFYGMADQQVLKMLIPEMSDKEIEEAITQKNQYLIKLFGELAEDQKEKYLTPGLKDFLSFLQTQKIKCAVVSASEDIIVKETLRCFGLDSFMCLQMGRNQTQNTKPHPEPYIEAMKRLNSPIENTLIFEDSPTGMQSALASKATVIRITHFAHHHSTRPIDGKFLEIKDFIC